MTTTTDTAAEAMRQTTDRIVAAIADGIADPDNWRAPWHDADPDAMTPTNPTTGQSYTGGNRFALAMRAMFDGAATEWATYKQWQSIDANVRKGERGTYIIRPATSKRTDENGDETMRIVGWRAHVVFHAGQVDGYTAAPPVVRTGDTDTAADIDNAYTWAATIGARVVESASSGAFYRPGQDFIGMPDRSRFADGHGCWSTMAHELTHWTGHESRLARTFGKKFGDDAYAAEELCAELGAAFTLAVRGRSTEPRPDHARYLAHWLAVLNSAPDALWSVASKAEAAAGYLADRAIDIRQVAA